MKTRNLFLIAWAGLASLLAFEARAVDYVSAPPLSSIKLSVENCRNFNDVPVPVIQWGADAATSLANGNAKRTAPNSIFAGKRLDISLYRQDNFVKQIADYASCKTPFLRATMGMLAQASEALDRDARTKPIVIYQLSWSAGGDALVVKDNIKSPADLKGKTIAVQAYGPHIDYMLRILSDAGLKPSDVKIKYTPDLSQADEKSVSPVLAFREDKSVDAAFVIIPDAQVLRGDDKEKPGTEGSVRGARILLSTKTASAIITDVYVVRADYFERNRAQIMSFTNGLMLAEEKLREIMKTPTSSEYQRTLGAAAELLLDSSSSTAIKDLSGMYGDADFAGYRGNVKFFTDVANPRGFEKVAGETTQALISLGLLSRQVPLASAKWDFTALAVGLADVSGVEAPRFNPQAVQQLVDTRAKQGGKEGVLFEFEIYFEPNQNNFSADQYSKAFDKIIELASTYGGALMTVEGHSDPLDYLREKKNGASPMVLNKIRQSTRNLSQARANAVKDSVVGYAGAKKITLDPSQFGVVGLGVSQPNTPRCKLDTSGDIDLSCAPSTEQEWNATRRVVFKIIQIEAEASAFNPL